MHKSLFNEAIIKLTIEPVGPILIKAGDGASDPTKPDMNFVRTMRGGKETVYLPGSSLKGVLRAHCERLARTVQHNNHLSCNPLHEKESCGARLKDKTLSAEHIHKQSCFLCRLFGNTSLASHFRTSDAYPMTEYRTEERNGVAIDRVFGSVAVGPFNYETVTSGQFQTTLYIKNFTLAQLGLLSLTMRDLAAERVRLGFGKSRGLGVVTARVEEMTLRYPSCSINATALQMLDGRAISDANKVVGVGKFVEKIYGDGSAAQYGYDKNDETTLPDSHSYQPNEWDELEIRAPQSGGQAQWEPLGARARRVGKRRCKVANEAVTGYVYCTELGLDDLRRLLAELFHEGDDIIVRRINAAAFPSFSTDGVASLLADWDEGQIFNASAELRWRREGERWAALLLSESSKESLLSEQRDLIEKWQAVTHAPFSAVNPSKLNTHGFLLWGTRQDGDQWWETRIPRPLQYPPSLQSQNNQPPQLAYWLYRHGETVRWIRLAKREEGKARE